MSDGMDIPGWTAHDAAVAETDAAIARMVETGAWPPC